MQNINDDMRSFIAVSNNPTLIIDSDSSISYINPAFEKLTGYSSSYLVGKKAPYPWWSKEQVGREDEDNLLAKRGIKEIIYKNVNGMPFWVEASYVQVKNNGKSDYYIITWNDITNRKNTEQKLRNQIRYLKGDQQKLLSIIDFLPDATFVVDKNKKVIAWNRAIEKMTNVGKKDILGEGNYAYALPFYGAKRPILIDLTYLNKDELDLKYNYIKREGGTVFGEAFVTHLHRGKGAYLWGTASPLFDEDGNFLGAIESIRDITKNKLMGETLKAEKQKFQALSDNAPFGMVLISKDGQFKYVNSKFTQIFGYDLNDVPNGKTWFRKAYPDTNYRHNIISAWIGDIEKFGSERVARTFTATCKDQQRKVVDLETIKLQNGDYLMTCEDVTKQKQVEEELKISYKKLQDMIDFLPDATFVVDKDKKVIAWNRAIEKMTDVTKEEMLGKGDQIYGVPFYGHKRAALTDLIFSKNKENVAKYDNIETTDNSIYAEEYLPSLRKGTGAYVWVKASPLLDDNGNIVGAIETIRDVTEKKLSNDELKKSHKRLQDIIDFLPDATFVVDKNKKVISWNRAIEKMTGVRKEEMLGEGDYAYALPFYGIKRPVLIDMTYLKDGELESKYNYIKRGGCTVFGEAFVPNLQGDKSAYLLGTAAPLFDGDGNFLGAIESIRDITERKQLEEELRNARDELEIRINDRTAELEARNAEMERFIYTVSHDLRSPLFTIEGFIGFLKEDIKTGEKDNIELDLKTISKAITNMDQFLRDTLELSRIGRIADPSENVPFGEIVNDALDQVSEKIRQNNVKVSVSGNWPIVHVDRRRMIEVLVNLIENSIKYMGVQEKPEIIIDWLKNDRENVFFVQDDGMGIDAHQHEKIFELFYKIDKKSEGTGAGMTIVKRIIEVHNGRIWIESETGRGCKVNFTLPIKPSTCCSREPIR